MVALKGAVAACADKGGPKSDDIGDLCALHGNELMGSSVCTMGFSVQVIGVPTTFFNAAGTLPEYHQSSHPKGGAAPPPQWQHASRDVTFAPSRMPK